MTAASTTVQDSSAQMDTPAQRGEIKQRLTELVKIISKLEDVGDSALADLFVARKAEKETLRGRLQEYKPTSQRLKLARAIIAKSERRWRRCGCFWMRRHKLGGKRRWHSRSLSRKRIHGLPDYDESKSKVSAVAMPMHGMCPGTPQLWAAGLATALPPEVAMQFRSWLGSVSSDAMGHQLLESGADGLECEVDVLDAQSNSSSSVLSPSASSRAALAFAPFRAAAQRTRKDPHMPPLLRGAVKPGQGKMGVGRRTRPRRQSLGRPRRPRQRLKHQRWVASCHVGSY